MIIDFHTHNFPDTLAPRAMESLIKISETQNIKAHTDGTASGAKKLLKKAGVDRAVVCNIATNPRQEQKVNGYAIELGERDDFFIPLGSIHPDSEAKDEELDRLQGAGIRGIKIHPDYVRVPITDERFDRIFKLAAERGMFVVTHAGFDPVSPDKVHATPEMLLKIITRHPELKLICAHMGGFGQAEKVRKLLVGTPVYLDTSLTSLRGSEREELIGIIKEHSKSRILFGTDTPWSCPDDEVRFVRESGLSAETQERIFYKNALELIGQI